MTVPCPGRNANMTGDSPHLCLPISQKTSPQSGVLLGLSPQVGACTGHGCYHESMFQTLTEDLMMSQLETVPENSATPTKTTVIFPNC